MAPSNSLPIWGNEKTMNLNSMILTNVQSSPYFKVNLFGLKTYHEVIDEIYYKVNHLEPWEKGSRKTAGQTGMCGGVRGVGAGGIVSTSFCILYKLYTLKLTRKQVMGLMNHNDSPYIRALGFMYVRYTQPPADLWEWYEPYLNDEEEIDVKAGGGHVMTIGEMLRQWLTKLEWYATLFPRIPVPTQKTLDTQLRAWEAENLQPPAPVHAAGNRAGRHIPDEEVHFGEAERMAESDRRRPANARPSPPFDIARAFDRDRNKDDDRSHDRSRRSRSGDRHRRKSRSRSRDRQRRRSRDRNRSRERHRSRSRERRRSKERRRSRERHSKKNRSRSRDRRRSRSRDRRRSKSKDRRRSRSRDRKKSAKKDGREDSFERDLKREIKRQRKDENGS